MFDSWPNCSIILVNARGAWSRQCSMSAWGMKSLHQFYFSFLSALSARSIRRHQSISFGVKHFYMDTWKYLISFINLIRILVLQNYQLSWLPRLLLIVSIWSNWGRTKSGLQMTSHSDVIGWPRWLCKDIKLNTRWRCGTRGWIAWGGPQYVTRLFSLSHPLTLSLTWTFLAWTKARMHWKQLIYQMFYEKSIFLTDWIHCDLLWSDESEMLYI